MKELTSSPYFGIALTALVYSGAVQIQRRTRLVLCNSVLLSTLAIIALLTVCGIPYADYNAGGSIINLFLAPATVCMAVSIYARRELLKKSLVPILAGCGAGAVTSVVSVWALCRLFGLDAAMTASLLPKSVTTPIATALAESHGGIPAFTVAAVIITGMIGNAFAPQLIRLFRVQDPVEAGVGIGACSHAMGTARALELGETEGAMSGLAIGLCGIFTTVLALGFSALL